MASSTSCPGKGSKTKSPVASEEPNCFEVPGRPCNLNQVEIQEQELDPRTHAVEISIRNCTRPGCKHHTTSEHICVWPQPCPADCFEQHPITTRAPKHCIWPVN